MISGMQRLREAKAHVLTGAAGRGELGAAFRCFSQASGQWHLWPASLRGRAERLLASCFRHGGIDDSVARLTDVQAAEARDAIRRFVDDAEEFGGAR